MLYHFASKLSVSITSMNDEEKGRVRIDVSVLRSNEVR